MTVPRRLSRRPPRRHPARIAAAAVGAVVLVGAIGVGAVLYRLQIDTAQAAGAIQASRTAVASRTAAASRSAAASSAVQAAQAAAAARAAQVADTSATAAAADAQQRLAAAQRAAAQVSSLAAPALARNPSAQDPSTALGPLQQAETSLATDVQTAQRAASTASSEARSAADAAQSNPAAADGAAQAQAAASSAASALQQVTDAQTKAIALASSALTAVQDWVGAHTAPAGYLGVQVQTPPRGWGVPGCEVTTAVPGGPAYQMGMVGRTQRTDPAGDTISSITDATDGGAVWRISNCTDFQAAMVQTRVGDKVTVGFYHRQVIWYLLSGKWVPETGTVTLSGGPATNCPKPLTGTFSPALAGNRINLTVTLSGPTGNSGPMGLILDTGGVQTYLPNALLQHLGYTAFWETIFGGVVPRAMALEHLYHVPGRALTVDDGGKQVPLAAGTLTIAGMPAGGMTGLGPDILKLGSKLATSGDYWTLTPPCGQ